MKQSMQLLTSQASQEWYTPEWLIVLARAVLGDIDLDPASNAVAQQWVGARRYYTLDDDGFKKPWAGRVWLNPPYDDTPRWVARLCAAYDDGDVTAALFTAHLLATGDPSVALARTASSVFDLLQSTLHSGEREL